MKVGQRFTYVGVVHEEDGLQGVWSGSFPAVVTRIHNTGKIRIELKLDNGRITHTWIDITNEGITQVEYSREQFDKIISKVLKEAKSLSDISGMNGEKFDGGELLRTQAEYFNLGMRGLLPDNWQKYARKVEQEDTPEYQKYLELKRKFGE
jgi:hypothetical protein